MKNKVGSTREEVQSDLPDKNLQWTILNVLREVKETHESNVLLNREYQ